MKSIPENILNQCKELSTKDWANLTKHYRNPTRFKIPQKAIGLREAIVELYPQFDFVEASALLRVGRVERPKCGCGNDLTFQIADYNYTQYCKTCRRTVDVSCSKAIVVNGVHYGNIERAMAALNMHRFDIRKKLLSSDANWVFAENHTKQCTKLIESITPALLDK
ncbi:hypothetical protein UFOVP116_426, partial [uncultured Caudovirales phage]